MGVSLYVSLVDIKIGSSPKSECVFSFLYHGKFEAQNTSNVSEGIRHYWNANNKIDGKDQAVKTPKYRLFDWFGMPLREGCRFGQVSEPRVVFAIPELYFDLNINPDMPIEIFVKNILQDGLRKKNEILSQFFSEPKQHATAVKYDVFLSYGSGDRDLAEEIKDMLSAKKLNCFFADESIPLGHEWIKSIFDALNSSQVGVFLITRDSFKSSWLMAEAGAIWVQGKPIVVAHMYIQLSEIPELITQFQCKEIKSLISREELVKDILDLCNKKS